MVFVVLCREELTRQCLEKGTEVVQGVINALFSLPSAEDLDGPIVRLPEPSTKLPREKHVRELFSLISCVIVLCKCLYCRIYGLLGSVRCYG